MLYKFIGRNGKRKARKVAEPRSHQKQPSTSEQSQVASPLVFDINEESLIAQSSPLVELTFLNTNEEWFPRDLLRSRSRSPEPFPQRVRNATVTQNNSAQEAHTNTSPVPSFSHLETSSSLPARKKSIPAPIVIPDHVVPNVQIGHSALPSQTFLTRPNANGAPGNSPSASISDNLSAVSGTTLARALIASSFVLSSERRSLRHRSGIVRQDSATLPRGSFFLSDSRSSSPIPPVPPVPATLANTTPDSNHLSTAIHSGTSTQSEYPMTDSYITSPEMADSSVIPRWPSRVQESPLRKVPKGPLALPITRSQRKAGPIPSRSRALKNGVFDGPKTAVEVPLASGSRETAQHSSQEGSALLTSDDHSLDEFDFIPPESLVIVDSPASDSSTSYVSRRRGDTFHGQWRRRAGGLDRAQNNSRNSSLADSAALHQTLGISSATTSEHDFGELLHYDLISPESSTSLSSASAGYQTFPETPMVFSPPWSSGFAFLAKSDSQVARRRMSNLRPIGRGSSKAHSSLRAPRRPVGNDDGGNISQSSLSSKQKPPSPRETEPSLPPIPAIDDAKGSDETNQSPTTETAGAQQAEEPSFTVRPHPLAHISSSSSCLLEEEVLRVLARHSPSSSSCIDIGNEDSLLDTITEPVAVVGSSTKSPMAIPLPESTDVSPSNSPALLVVSSLASHPLQPSVPSTTAINQSSHHKSPPASLRSSLGGSSFLPSLSMSSPLRDESPPQSHSVIATISSSLSPNDLGSHSPSPSFVPPPPYHTVVLGRTPQYPSSTLAPSLSRTPSADPLSQRSRQASSSSLASCSARTRARSRPPLPIGPRKPSRPGQGIGSLFSGIRGRNSSASSVASGDLINAGFPWHKLHSVASKPSPKFQAPPQKWRGLTLEAAQWTFTSVQLQEIVSQAIQQSFEGSSLRFVRPEILEGEIADELQCLELQHVKIKAQYKELAQKRWVLMGALAGHVEGVEMSDATTAMRTVEELAEVLSVLDHHAEKMHDIVLQIAELQKLRDVHNTSALALAVRKINGVFVRQMAEKEHLQGQVDTLAVERDEAWKHAEDIAQDYDMLNDRVSEESAGDASNILSDARSMTTRSRRSARISVIRKSNIRQSRVGLRPRSQYRDGRRSPSNSGRPTSLSLVDIPPVPRLPVDPMIGTSALPTTGVSFGSVCGTWETSSASLALAEAQREVYEMLGLSLPPSQASSRRRTLSGPTSPASSPSHSMRPVSGSFDRDGQLVCTRRARSRQGYRQVTRSVTLSDRFDYVRPLTVAQR